MKELLLGILGFCAAGVGIVLVFFNKFSKRELFNVKEWGQVFDIMHFIANFSYRGHLLCPCGSGKRLRNCHGDILMKVMNAGLKTECKEILIELKKIYDRKGN